MLRKPILQFNLTLLKQRNNYISQIIALNYEQVEASNIVHQKSSNDKDFNSEK